MANLCKFSLSNVYFFRFIIIHWAVESNPLETYQVPIHTDSNFDKHNWRGGYTPGSQAQFSKCFLPAITFIVSIQAMSEIAI